MRSGLARWLTLLCDVSGRPVARSVIRTTSGRANLPGTGPRAVSEAGGTIGQSYDSPNRKGSDVIIAAYARTLCPGISIAQFIEAWRPEGGGEYPA